MPGGRPRGGSKVDVELARTLRERGYSWAEIGDSLGVSSSAVRYQLDDNFRAAANRGNLAFRNRKRAAKRAQS